MTLFELLNRMTSEELTLQWAYDNIQAEEQRRRDLDARAQQNLHKGRRG